MSREFIFIIAIVLGLVLLAGVVFTVKRRRNGASAKVAAETEDERAGESLSGVKGSTPSTVRAELNWYQRLTERVVYYRYARSAYKAARGTQHRMLLQAALRRLVQEQKANEQEISAIERQLQQLRRAENAELQTRLQHWIATAHLREVPGIGAKRYDQLMRHVFDGKLEDFYRAKDRVSGIGDKTQLALNAWVKHYKHRSAGMVQSDFPGKQAVVSAYAKQREPLLQQQTALKEDIADMHKAREPIKRELAWLNQVDFGTFRKTYKHVNADADRYLLGVFAEWEEMPDWFKSVMKTEA